MAGTVLRFILLVSLIFSAIFLFKLVDYTKNHHVKSLFRVNGVKVSITDGQYAQLPSSPNKVLEEVRHAENYTIIHGPPQQRNKSLFQYIDIKDTDVPSRRSFFCKTTKTTPNFTICVYEREKDVDISANLLDTGIWRPIATALVGKALDVYPRSALLDIGANIGYFSQLAAAKGHSVLAIEPVDANIERFVAACHYDRHWNLIQLLRNAISDSHTKISMSTNSRNQGYLFINNNPGTADPKIQTLTLNDLRRTISSRIVVIKIDIESHECKAFNKSAEFFNKIFVPYIFMEWLFAEHSNLASSCSRDEVQRLVHFLTDRGYSPYEPQGFGLKPLNLVDINFTFRNSFNGLIWKHKDAVDIK